MYSSGQHCFPLSSTCLFLTVVCSLVAMTQFVLLAKEEFLERGIQARLWWWKGKKIKRGLGREFMWENLL